MTTTSSIFLNECDIKLKVLDSSGEKPRNIQMKNKKVTTNLIRGGLKRSNFSETSEPLFLTSGFVYETAEEAEKSFKE